MKNKIIIKNNDRKKKQKAVGKTILGLVIKCIEHFQTRVNIGKFILI